MALAVTAVVLTALATAVPVMLRASDAASERLERVNRVEQVLSRMESELSMAVREPLVLSAAPAPRLEFTGGAEPGERIVYALEGGALVRRAADGVAAPVLAGVGGIELAAFDGRDWVREWRKERLPEAVRIRVRFDDGEAAETLVRVPVAARGRSR